MLNVDELFYNRSCKPAALVGFGFKATDGGYLYREAILGGQFELRVRVQEGRVYAEVYDIAAEENYFLHLVEGAEGGFVGAVRAEYERVLHSVSQSCFERALVFREACSEAVIAYAKKRYGDSLEFLWRKFPENAVLRRRDNGKWYAAILTVERSKLGIEGDGKIEILDLRAPKDQLHALIDNKNYFPGYHMNKQSWFTVPLDGRVAAEIIYSLIDISYGLAQKA